MSKNITQTCCDAPECEAATTDPKAPGWTNPLFPSALGTKVIHLCPEHSKLSVAEAFAIAVPPPAPKPENK